MDNLQESFKNIVKNAEDISMLMPLRIVTSKGTFVIESDNRSVAAKYPSFSVSFEFKKQICVTKQQIKSPKIFYEYLEQACNELVKDIK